MYTVQTIRYEPQIISRQANFNLFRLALHLVEATDWVTRFPPGQEVVVAYGTFAPPLP